MSENVPFFEHMQSKFAKTALWAQQLFFIKISVWSQKNAEFYADSKFYEMGSNKYSDKKL